MKALEKASIDHCGTHSMRHTAIKMMKKRGLSLHLIGKIVGQHDLGVTNNYGIGVDQEDIDAAADAIGDIWKLKLPVTLTASLSGPSVTPAPEKPSDTASEPLIASLSASFHEVDGDLYLQPFPSSSMN